MERVGGRGGAAKGESAGLQEGTASSSQQQARVWTVSGPERPARRRRYSSFLHKGTKSPLIAAQNLLPLRRVRSLPPGEVLVSVQTLVRVCQSTPRGMYIHKSSKCIIICRRNRGRGP